MDLCFLFSCIALVLLFGAVVALGGYVWGWAHGAEWQEKQDKNQPVDVKLDIEPAPDDTAEYQP